MPILHVSHSVFPVADSYWPLAHGVQTCGTVGSLVKYVPAAHVLVVQAACPVFVWYMPTLQSGHDFVWPALGWAVPALHGVQTCGSLAPLEKRVPAGHVLGVQDA